ncbi:monosaccharide ABC transporter substrate-binding protein (CUT2 family) [Halanaerobium saccharolyticum]|uniref:Monosaccharide ABC transporter substrate-binding protein (CUT2 family) n=1 Tax=Halanaerobium saccharolyticum TaxID=43595 RepID=A0A4R7Z2A8_9FIRM|nr:substrate-binding domain-containing protein [Halanaerobium saccharolyticum]RAK08184.1 monosaccharide ABC transporter substrate-binding protein (CUT2 family) [Halanaerobium saccharolyticum]TDW04391.1 monosaccharide ABC transporter substrate-binding protein (CUT2 family) [Halanaerobium saccharolyticum]TDX59682.1 monosaccharide ABC transporter substrate-binding protein (CUT2 family) [Halanaerobium saccharolyticum]
MLKKIALITLSILLFAALFSAPAVAQEESEDPVEIYFFPGGSPGGTFATIVYNGAVKAAEILGDRVNVHYRWSEWSPQQMVSQFQQAVAANPDGIAIMGHPGDDAYEPFVEEAVEQGIIVTSQNTTLPELEERYKSEGFGYVGQELYPSGQMLGNGCVNRFDLGEGDKALVWGLRSKPTRGQRTQGVIDALEEAGLEVDYMEISAEVDKDASNGIPVITGYLQSNPDCDLVVTDHGNLTASMRTYLESAGFGPDEIIGAGFDLSPATAEAIKSGYTDLVLDQQPYLQGFLPIMQIYLTEKWKFSGLHIDTGAGLIHEGNIDMIAPLAEEGIR